MNILCKNSINLNQDTEDSLCWSLDFKGDNFTTKLGYKVVFGNMVDGPSF
jgi:hypothetical protein